MRAPDTPLTSMELTPREKDKLLIFTAALLAERRRARGLKLNYPEAVAIISATALDGARAGRTIEEVTKEARTALTKADVLTEEAVARQQRRLGRAIATPRGRADRQPQVISAATGAGLEALLRVLGAQLDRARETAMAPATPAWRP